MLKSKAATPRVARPGAVRRPSRTFAGLALLVGAVVAMPSADAAETGQPNLPEVVVGATPLPGTAVPIDELPGEVHSLELPGVGGIPGRSATGALADRFAGIGLEDALGDAWQSSLAYRGFAASPVLGTPQGLAVYQDGVRLNEAFGDVVNWDLVPMFAVRRIDVAGASPVYGANALGGAVAFAMKNGVSDRGLAAELERGAFATRAASVEYGGRSGGLAYYAGGRLLDEDGARAFSANSLRQLYADLRYVTARGLVALSITSAHDRLDGPGAAPVQELAVSRALTFTGPQATDNRLGLATLRAESRLGESASITGVAYYRRLAQDLANGNTTGYRACTGTGTTALLCQADGVTPLAGIDGAPVLDPGRGGAMPLGENDLESVIATTRGGSVQLAEHATLFGLGQALAVGASVDASRIAFDASTRVGALDSQLQVVPGGPVIATAEGTAFAATPVGLGVRSRTLGAHASDAVTLTSGLTLTVSAQYAVEDLGLADRRGPALTGSSRYQRLNPAVGITYRVAAGPTVYAGYAETARAPTPSEIECSDPARPCLLPSTLAGDPPRLKQVVARTWEAGLRRASGAAQVAGLGYSAGVFRADLADDIYGIATGTGSGYYANVGATRRQGASLDVSYHAGRWSAFASAALVDATFRGTFSVPSPENPFADANGDVAVRPGARLPGIARLRASAGGEWHATPALSVGASLTAAGPSYFHGDESNQNPRLPGYARLDLHSTLALGERVELTLAILNALDAHYATSGLYADPTGIGAPGVPVAGSGVAADPRFESPAPPLAWRLALRVRL